MTESQPLTERQRYWLQHLRACAAEQQSLKAYARQHRLQIQTLYAAKKQLKRQGLLDPSTRAPRFLRLTPAPAWQAPATCRVLLANGAVVEWSCGAEALGSVLAAAARLP
jgi:hypothetical protein